MNAALNDLLKQTSRSFYLTLRVLPPAIRPQVSLAYLLARAADTISDTEILPVQQRLAALQQLRSRMLGQNSATPDFSGFARRQGTPAEKMLLEKTDDALAELEKFSDADQRLIRSVLDTITSGQELDLRRFSGATAEKIIPLQTPAELDDYTWRVAGCVGEFWSKLCRAHLFPRAKINEAQWLADAVRFGKGLQLVNILRDLPADLRNGRCYLPAQNLSALGLAPADLLDPANEPRLRPLYRRWLETAAAHLAAGWAYTDSLPRAQPRLRLACAWPILIGAKTIAQLRATNVLDASQRVKITRPEVRRLIAQTLCLYPFPGTWRRQLANQTH